MTKLGITSSAAAIGIGLALAHGYGPGFHPCRRLEHALCTDLGPADCAEWQKRDRPGMPEPPEVGRGRGRRAVADAVFALVLDWDPAEPVAVCRGLSTPASRDVMVRAVRQSLHR